MQPKQVMESCPIEGNPMAVRIYPTGGRVLSVRGTSGGTNIPDQSSDSPDLSVYLRDDLPICVAAVSLRSRNRWDSMFIRVQLSCASAVAEMDEPFVHPRYPTSFEGWRVSIQVQGEWYATSTLNLVGKVVTTSSMCQLLAGTITEEEFIASAEGESSSDKLARLERENAGLRRTVEMQGELARSREDDYRLAVSWMKRLWVASGNTRPSFGRMGDESWLGMWEQDLKECLLQRGRYADKLASACRFLELLEEQLARRWFTGAIRTSIAQERMRLTVPVATAMLVDEDEVR